MKNIRLIVGLMLLVVVVSLTIGIFSAPMVKDCESSSFSAERVAEDIKIISKEHHSVLDDEARNSVRQYLSGRLASMGGTPVEYSYDSIKYQFGGLIDISNLYCVFEPENSTPSSYVMMVAHLDSRYPMRVLKDTVQSYGAADDGYGLSVVLEIVNQAIKYRDQWKQGVKILFTDSEENNLDGMRCADSLNRELFDNVGLVVNIDARGVKGPVLLFETSSGNQKLMSLYKKSAKFHSTYSITAVAYKFLPNLTDFMIVKEKIPGLNFSSVGSLSTYHTDKDCFDNIDLRTIQHYGAQIEPIIRSYLTKDEYSDPNNLRATNDSVFFSVPGFHLFKFTNGQYKLFNLFVLLLFCIAFAFNYLTSSVNVKSILRYSLILLLSSLLFFALGEGVAYISALINGTEFSITDTKYVSGEYAISILYFAFMVVATLCYIRKRKRVSKDFLKEVIFASMAVMLLFSALLLFTIGENFFFLVPVALGSISMICYPLSVRLVFSLAGSIAIAIFIISFLSVLLIAVTIGSLGLVAFIGFYSLILIIGLFGCFLEKRSR